jgi:hypothetical protein
MMQKKAIESLCCKRVVEKEEADNFSSTVIVQKEDPVLLRAGEFLSSVEKSLVVISPPRNSIRGFLNTQYSSRRHLREVFRLKY